jgi:hypothetical protein
MPDNRLSRPDNSVTRAVTSNKEPKKSKPTVFQSLKRRDLLILIAFWLTCVCVVALLIGFFVLRRSDISQPPLLYELKAGNISALKLYPPAQTAALAWESDVQFISASATWEHATLSRLEEPAEWVYRFYSPSLQRIVFVVVSPDQKVIVRPHLDKVRREQRVIDSTGWRMDSPAAITEWLNHGGGGWLKLAPNAMVSAQLTFDSTESAPAWIVSGIEVETGQSISYKVKATSP